MICTSARRVRLSFYLSLALMLLTLASGCRSGQSAFQFRPAPTVAARPVPAPVVDAVPVVVAEVPAPAKPVAAPQAVEPAPLRPRHLRQQLRRAVAQAVAPRQLLKPLLAKPAAQGVRRAAGPRHTAEVGLGTTVLGVLGLVVLPISLIGLLIWGGPVWAILAGLAALAVLVAYLDPFG
ncbi:hypothetical protein [Hymenobacter wooponensis]|uniref:Uncharacterized protein n=1 Tax=Hymenobacter wooponensis TaxID=1525360 RepID=A0A4Z0MEG1_9BACT|nr:hypothetical protein [Hymenobacter wooponensis]TGD77921.1 hypothetical protein EU557_21765 [Hymenobacter wooponensis]